MVSKARQIGFSTIIAAEGVHAAATRPSYRANYISINEKEAADKLVIAKALFESIPSELASEGLRPVIWNDAQDEFAFHAPPHTSSLISKPASSGIRGGRKDIYFDEAAHIKNFNRLYQAGLPAILRGEGRITVISTPMDESGLFYDIVTDAETYKRYSRHVVPWWESIAMVKPEYQEEALAEAATMSTEARVLKYGTDKLISIYEGFGHDIMGFQTEHECQFVDELSAYYPWELIVDSAADDIEFFKREIPLGWKPEGQLSLGVDLAKERDESVFTLVETLNDEDGEDHHYIRWIKTTQEPYKDQWTYLGNLIQRIKPSRTSIDKTGVGNVLFEQLNGYSGLEGVQFTQAKKENWATKFKGDLQVGRVHYPRDPELMKQIHGIRRLKTENNLYKFSGKKDDYFWSLMLALYGEGRGPVRFSIL